MLLFFHFGFLCKGKIDGSKISVEKNKGDESNSVRIITPWV